MMSEYDCSQFASDWILLYAELYCNKEKNSLNSLSLSRMSYGWGYLVNQYHRKYKWLEWVSNPPLLGVCLRLSKSSIWEKIPDRPLDKPLKLIQDISEKSGQVADKIPHKSSFFWAIFELYFSSKPNLSYFFSLNFDCIPVFIPDFCMSQKSLRQICKVCN